jgi:uncharacterized protein YndB with AHSA1/START domain
LDRPARSSRAAERLTTQNSRCGLHAARETPTPPPWLAGDQEDFFEMAIETLELTKIPSMTVGMLVRKPAHQVFEAIADPAVTTRFWFTKSTGRLTPGADVTWTWEMFRVSTHVNVREVEDDRRIVLQWNNLGIPTTVQWRFVPWKGGQTYVQVTESGFSGSGDDIASAVAGSTGGFTNVLCALKALMEHDIELDSVRDHAPPKGLEI